MVLGEKTASIRHRIVKLIAPKLYEAYVQSLVPTCESKPFRSFDEIVASHFSKSSGLTGVEIGVWKAEHSLNLLKSVSFRKLYLIDPYYTICDNPANIETMKQRLEIARENIQQYTEIVEFCVDTSENASRSILDELDVVYIDGDHSYNAVLRDAGTWYNKVRMGGILGGHDFTPKFQSVVRAVLDFCYSKECRLNFAGEDWWIIRGEPISTQYF